MPLPLAPIASFALRRGAVALAGLALAHVLPRVLARVLARHGTTQSATAAQNRRPSAAALGDLPEGIGFDIHGHRTGLDIGRDIALDARGRWRRVLRLGRRGPGFEIDLAGIARMTIRKVRT